MTNVWFIISISKEPCSCIKTSEKYNAPIRGKMDG